MFKNCVMEKGPIIEYTLHCQYHSDPIGCVLVLADIFNIGETICELISISHDINHPVLIQNKNVLQHSLRNFQYTRKKHEIINRSRFNLAFSGTAKEVFQWN